MNFDAFLLVSYGGPEGQDDVLPFLERVLNGKHVPEARKNAVYEKYLACGGYSPLNDQSRRFLSQLKEAAINEELLLYRANLYTEPFVPDVIEQIRQDGVRRVLMMISSPFGSAQSCRRYLDNVYRTWPHQIELAVIPCFGLHPLYVKAVANRLLTCCAQAILDTPQNLPASSVDPGKPETLFMFTAHALPIQSARIAQYEEQLTAHYQQVLKSAQVESDRELAPSIARLSFQSRSGRPSEPWTEPNVQDAIKSLRTEYPTLKRVIVTPSGFLFDNMEIISDLDIEVRQVCEELGLAYYRSGTAGLSPEMTRLCRDYLSMTYDSFAPCHCSPDNCDYSCSIRRNIS